MLCPAVFSGLLGPEILIQECRALVATLRDCNFQLKQHAELLVTFRTHVESPWRMIIQAETFNKLIKEGYGMPTQESSG